MKVIIEKNIGTKGTMVRGTTISLSLSDVIEARKQTIAEQQVVFDKMCEDVGTLRQTILRNRLELQRLEAITSDLEIILNAQE